MKKTTIREKLGAFMVTRDPSAKAKTDKEKSKGESKGHNESVPSLGETKDSGYIMLALDVQEEVPCHSCGYPTMTALAPESLTKFDRKYTCSTSCFRSLAHYKSADSNLLETMTVKRAADALRAATAFAVKALRMTNAEEVGSGDDMVANSMSVAVTNQVQIMKMLNIVQSYIWNASHQVADGCNRRLYDAKTYAGLADGKPAMGQVQPSLIGRKGKKWCTALMKKTRREKVDLDVTKHVEWNTIAAEITRSGTGTLTILGPQQSKKAALLTLPAGVVDDDMERKTEEVKQLRNEVLSLKMAKAALEHQTVAEKEVEALRKEVDELRKELNALKKAKAAQSERADRAEVQLTYLIKAGDTRLEREIERHGIEATMIQNAWRHFTMLQESVKGNELQQEIERHGIKATMIQNAWRRFTMLQESVKGNDYQYRSAIIYIVTIQSWFRQKAASKYVEQRCQELVKGKQQEQVEVPFNNMEDELTQEQRKTDAKIHQQETTPIGGHFKQDMDERHRVLVDTPEQAPAPSRPKILRQGKGQPKSKNKEEIVFDSVVVWIKEELQEEEYGIARWKLKQHGVEKGHVDNMHRVMSDDYPALRDVIKCLVTNGTSAEEVADTITGVPTRKGNKLLSSLEDKMKDLLGPPEPFPDDCQYIHLGKDQATFQSQNVIERSEKLYHKKMSDSGEVKEMMLVECGIHAQTEVKMVLKMSKSGETRFVDDTFESLLYQHEMLIIVLQQKLYSLTQLHS